MRTPQFAPMATVLLAAMLLAACDSTPTETEPLADQVRAETAKYQNTDLALQDGYVPDGHCVAHPSMGGMGDHWVNQNLVDPNYDPMVPEVLLFAPGGGGEATLVGVEYIVIDVGQARPDFDGHPFDVGGVPPLMDAGVDHWSLHVWLHLDNPSGLFAPFNPSVSCD